MILTRDLTMLMGECLLPRSLSQGLATNKNTRQNPAGFYSCKMTDVVPPADCLGFGDRPGWIRYKGRIEFSHSDSAGYIFPFLFSVPFYPKYTFMISWRHASRSNMAF